MCTAQALLGPGDTLGPGYSSEVLLSKDWVQRSCRQHKKCMMFGLRQEGIGTRGTANSWQC